MTQGRLNPAVTKPGDAVAVKLNEDVRAHGAVVVKKGTIITGVVRSVNRAEAGSMMQIEWQPPDAQGKVAQTVSVALNSVTQMNPLKHEQGNATSFDFTRSAAGSAVARPSPTASSSAGSPGLLLGSAVGTVIGSASGQSNPSLLSMPTVVAVDPQTTSAIESGLGTTSSGQLFKVGRGQIVTANGSQWVDIFSHLNNDTVITAKNKDFEISTGAHMQLLVGVNKVK